MCVFLNYTATTKIDTDLHTLSRHYALPIFHLVERGRDAVFLKVPVDEEQKLVLLFGEHGSPGPPVCRPSARQRPQNMEQNKNFHACSSLVLHHRQALLTAS